MVLIDSVPPKVEIAGAMQYKVRYCYFNHHLAKPTKVKSFDMLTFPK